MNNMEIKIGDLVRLRNDLENEKQYGGIYYCNAGMKFEDFREVTFSDSDGPFRLNKMGDFWYTIEMMEEVKRPCQYKTIYERKEEILTDEEKEYLSAVIKPFRNRIDCITKYEYGGYDEQYIIIKSIKDEKYYLPEFASNTMYKGMELDKEYTLEELGI